jgi:hypothetical protein
MGGVGGIIMIDSADAGIKAGRPGACEFRGTRVVTWLRVEGLVLLLEVLGFLGGENSEDGVSR